MAPVRFEISPNLIKFSFSSIASKLLKDDKISLSLFGAYAFIICFVFNIGFKNDEASQRVKDLLMDGAIKAILNQDRNSTCVGAAMTFYNICTPFILPLCISFYC